MVFHSAVSQAKSWLRARSLVPTEVQNAVFSAISDSRSLLVTAPTGSGKTAAVMLPFFGLLADRLGTGDNCAGVRVLYLAPVRALIDGQTHALRDMAEGFSPRIRIDSRTGDSTTQQRAKIKRVPPHVLLTTPETLAVMLATETRDILATVEWIVLDEVHQLAAGKRGALLSVTLATLDALFVERNGSPARRIAMSATVKPLKLLAEWVSDDTRVIEASGSTTPTLNLADPPLDSPWPTGQWIWKTALPTVARTIATNEASTLVFVSARSRAEQWTLALRDILPARIPVACFHGSLSKSEREAVAVGLRDRTVRAVIATSGLEAGVDLPAVSHVMVVSSPTSVTRLCQAAGRADHRPGFCPKATVVATSAMDLVRCVAVMDAARRNDLEDVDLRAYDLDVAAQGVLGRVALGPCTRDEIAHTLRRAWSYRDIDDGDIDDVIAYLATGGDALAAYPELARIVTDGNQWVIAGKRSLRRYLQCAGTIVSEMSVMVRNGEFTVGQVEGRFAALLQVGDTFILGARTWRVVSLTAGEVQVRSAKAKKTNVPSWDGARAAQGEPVGRTCERLWGELAHAMMAATPVEQQQGVRKVLGVGEPNAYAVWQLLCAQQKYSVVPTPDTFVIERICEGSNTHVVMFTFAGAMANEVIVRALAARARNELGTGAQVSVSDECACVTFAKLDAQLDEARLRRWLAPDHLLEDLLASLEGGVLAGHYFREIARIAQLWTPERQRGTVTPGLLYDVLRKYDPDHVLLRALRFTLWTALDGPRAEKALVALRDRRIRLVSLTNPSAMSLSVFAWAARDMVAPEDPEAALAAAAHALFQRTTAHVESV
jgi:ATP-dependent helicase Lhr and Lhr-like helicase